MSTNADRAEKAYRTVLHYEKDSSVEERISDLLGDLRHLCDEQGYDYAELDGIGYRNYLAELGEERRGDGGPRPEAGDMSRSDGLGGENRLDDESLLTEAARLYERSRDGQAAVEAWARGAAIKDRIAYRDCEPCEARTPHIGAVCAVCRSQNPTDPVPSHHPQRRYAK